MVKFKEDSKIKPKAYPLNCVVEKDEYQFIIVITYNKCISSANNRIQRAQTQKKIHFYDLKVENKIS